MNLIFKYKIKIFTHYILSKFISKHKELYLKNKIKAFEYSKLIKLRPRKIDRNKLKICFIYLGGGIGDYLIQLNYIKKFSNYFNDIDIDVYGFNKIICFTDDFKDINFYSNDEINENINFYDVILDFQRRFIKPIILQKEYLCYYDKLLRNYLLKLLSFYNANKKIFNDNIEPPSSYDCISNEIGLLHGKKRINQPDIIDFFNLPNDFDLKFKLNKCYLDKFCLSNRKYITINNSVDSNTKNDFCHTKLMTDEQFNLLIDKLILVIKKKYNFDIVILGPVMAKLERKDVVDLRGKCSFGEFCSILKYSALHVGPEGGMIHMRKAFGTGPCCVWFGPTSPEIYGYDSNINFDYCSIHNCHCEWLINSWNKCCCVSEKKENCKKIKEMPLDVFVDEIRKKMESNIIKLRDI